MCGTGHTIPGAVGANANVGPSLDRVGGRAYVADTVLDTVPVGKRRRGPAYAGRRRFVGPLPR